MAATVRAVHNIEIPPADDMDMHSDAGIDFGDGDIELDMETAPAVPHHDDDMSIQDAASVTGQDGLTSLNEQDDFMADNEDLIEEDIEYHEEDHVVVTDHPSVTNDTVNQDDASAAVDEDLVDYSDDEDNNPQVDNAPVDQNPSLDDQDVEEHREHVVDQASEAQDASGINQDINIDQRSPEAENVQHNAASQQSVDSQRSPDRVTDPHDSAEATYHSEEEEDGGVPLQDPEGAVEPDHEQYEDHNESAQDEHDYQDVASNEHTEHQDHGSPALQPVTVNYAGNELWLFKDHDHDESGDWLLEDMNLAKSTMSDLFHACRSSLGDDVSHEHEIGFRFDHLHNLELYEDNTACVAVSLERLVELYHTLQTQDDNHEPDSFYMSLLFRPRFATLLSDVAKYAEQGSGYSALNAAVAAGDTHFANIVSNASSDEPTEWDNEDSEDNNEDQSHDASPHDEEQHDEHSEAGSFGHEAEDDHSQAAESENIDQAEANHSTGWDTQRDEATDESHLLGSSTHQHAPLPNDENVENDHIDEPEKQYVEGDGDLVDYGDEEGAESNPQLETDVATSHSQSSSTVHGDDVGATREDTFNFGFLETENQTDERDIPVPEDTEGNEPFYEDSTAYTNDDTAQPYQDYVGELQEGSFRDLQQEGVEEAVVGELNNDANQDFSAVQFHDTDHQPESDFMLAAEFNEGNTTDPFGDDFSGANDFLDIDHASEWIDNIEPASNFTGDMINNNDLFDANDGDEGGEAGAAALASSSAADPVTAPSSTELQESSLQGQKRSIDEAGDGVDDALESTDAKRARV